MLKAALWNSISKHMLATVSRGQASCPILLTVSENRVLQKEFQQQQEQLQQIVHRQRDVEGLTFHVMSHMANKKGSNT